MKKLLMGSLISATALAGCGVDASLDRENSDLILNQLKTLNAEGKTIVMVSHDKNAFSYCSRIVNLS